MALWCTPHAEDRDGLTRFLSRHRSNRWKQCRKREGNPQIRKTMTIDRVSSFRLVGCVATPAACNLAFVITDRYYFAGTCMPANHRVHRPSHQYVAAVGLSPSVRQRAELARQENIQLVFGTRHTECVAQFRIAL